MTKRRTETLKKNVIRDISACLSMTKRRTETLK